MTIRVYLMPQIGSGAGNLDAKRCKYRALLTNSATIHYGPEPYCIVFADVTTTQHNALVANSDVRALPEDLNTTITNAVRTAMAAMLEAANIPAQWITNGMTFRVFLRRLAGIFFMLQRVHGKKLRFLQAALDDPISALPANVRQAFSEAAQEFQLDATGITGSTTLRVALGNIGSQFAGRQLAYAGVTL